MREGLHVLYAFPEPLPLPRARAVQVAHAVAGLFATGVRVTLAYVPVEGHPNPFDAAGLPVPQGLDLLPLSRNWPFPFRRWHSVQIFARRLRKRLAAMPSRPDLILVRHVKLAAILLRDTPHIPLIYEAHEVFAETVQGKRRAQVFSMEQEVVKGALAIITNSQVTLDTLVQHYGSPARSIVLPNGVDLPGEVPEKPWQTAARHIVYTGSFFSWKGVDDLLQASRELPGCRITLVGGEPEQIDRIRKEYPTGGAELELLPRLPHAQVAGVLAGAAIAVLPNRPESDSRFTSPIKLFEYMGAGCAIVASDLPSIREVASDDEVAWFRPGDPAQLASTIRRLVADPDKAARLGAAVRARGSLYTWEARAERLANFLESAVP